MYCKLILKFAFFLQIIVAISFSFFQTPHFLGIFKGLKFDFISVVTMIFLRTLEWINFITLSSFIGAFLVIIGNHLRKNYIDLFLLQMGKSVSCLIMPIFFISFIGSLFMIAIDGFCVPYGNFFLKTKLLEISKNRIVSNLKPSHVISLDGWNFCVSNRVNDVELEGVLFNKEGESSISIFINKAQFQNQNYMSLNLHNGIGKIEIEDESLIFTFQEGEFNAPSDIVTVEKTKQNLNLFELNDVFDIMKRLSMAFVMLILPCWIFLMLFGSFLNLFIGSICFSIITFSSINIIPFNQFVFFGSIILLYLFYRNNNKNLRIK